jgi:hypothetical protein
MAFRWRSWLGLAVALFLVYGALNLLIAIATPLTLQSGGAGASGFPPVMSMDGDAALLGRPLEGLRQSDPKLDALLVSGMHSMCAMHISMATLVLGATWFGLRRGERWALWALALSAFGDRALLPAHLGQLRRAGGAGDERTDVDHRALGVSAGGVRRRTRRSQRDPRLHRRRCCSPRRLTAGFKLPPLVVGSAGK